MGPVPPFSSFLKKKAVHGVHNLSEGVAAVGSAARMASDSWKLARDARPETPDANSSSSSSGAGL